MKQFKILFFLSLGINVIALFFFIQNRRDKNLTSDSSKKIRKVQPNEAKITYFQKRDELFELLPHDSNSILFLGNSLTQNFELAELLQNLNVKNRGINGDLIEGVINRLGPIIKSHPKKIFIEIGINDLAMGISESKVLANYQRLLDTLKHECKTTNIYIQSLFPVQNGQAIFPAYCNPRINRSVVQINRGLRRYAKQHDFTFIDCYSQFELNGQLNPKYSVDGIHLSGEGYVRWAKIVRPYVCE